MKYLFLIFSGLIIISCSPAIHYFGDKYPKTSTVEIFYSQEDINKNYKVIGQLTGNPQIGNTADDVKNGIIENAKKQGADAILFLLNESFSAESQRYPIRADLLIYIN